jgi:hypothetical protein
VGISSFSMVSIGSSVWGVYMRQKTEGTLCDLQNAR